MDRCITVMGEVAEELDHPILKWTHMFNRTARAIVTGEADRAEALATETLQIGTDCALPDAATLFSSQFMMVSWLRGSLGDLVPTIEQMASDTPDIARALSAVLALAYAEADRTTDADRILDAQAADDFEPPTDTTWLTTLVCFAAAATECRNSKCAAPLFERLAPWADQFSSAGGITTEGPVSLYLGGLATVLGRYDEADDYLIQAAAMNERVGATFFAAQTSLWRGRMLAERGAPDDVDKARELLTAAHATGATHGYAKVERRSFQALQDLT